MNSKFKSRNFCILLYPLEDISHFQALEYIKLNFDFAFIEHNEDFDKNGEIKKSHTHVVLQFSNAKWNTALAEEIGISLNYIERCRSLENALDYLIHFNDDTKHQYSIDLVQGSLKSKLLKYIKNCGKDENEKILELLDYILDTKTLISFSSLSRYVCSLGYWDIFRRSSYILIKIVDEHNFKVLERSKIKQKE